MSGCRAAYQDVIARGQALVESGILIWGRGVPISPDTVNAVEVWLGSAEYARLQEHEAYRAPAEHALRGRPDPFVAVGATLHHYLPSPPEDLCGQVQDRIGLGWSGQAPT